MTAPALLALLAGALLLAAVMHRCARQTASALKDLAASLTLPDAEDHRSEDGQHHR